MARATAAEARGREAAIGPAREVARQPSSGVTARAVDVQLKAVAADVPIVWNGSSRSMVRSVTPRLLRSPYVSNDSTLRHAGAQHCWHSS
jgi:hypothetical protein